MMLTKVVVIAVGVGLLFQAGAVFGFVGAGLGGAAIIGFTAYRLSYKA